MGHCSAGRGVNLPRIRAHGGACGARCCTTATKRRKTNWTHLARLLHRSGAAGQCDRGGGALYVNRERCRGRAFASDRATDDDVTWLNWLLKNRLLGKSRARLRPGWPRSPRNIATSSSIRSRSARTMPGLADEGDGFPQPLFVRGDFLTSPGSPSNAATSKCWRGPKRLSTRAAADAARSRKIIANGDKPAHSARRGESRLAMASSARASMPARPMISGHLGDKPSHPESRLSAAGQFMTGGWSVKKLVRAIVLSRAFQILTAASTPEARGI